MNPESTSKKEKKSGKLTSEEQLGEIALILLSAGVLGEIYLWIVILA